MRRGEVRWYRFLNPDKQRPVVLLNRDSAMAYLGELTVAPITSPIRNIPSEVVLRELQEMPHECVVNLDHLQTVAKGKLGALVTTLPPSKMREIEAALSFALGFSELPQQE